MVGEDDLFLSEDFDLYLTTRVLGDVPCDLEGTEPVCAAETSQFLRSWTTYHLHSSF